MGQQDELHKLPDIPLNVKIIMHRRWKKMYGDEWYYKNFKVPYADMEMTSDGSS